MNTRVTRAEEQPDGCSDSPELGKYSLMRVKMTPEPWETRE